MSLAGATQDEVRRHNLAALARFLHDHGSTSRSELVSHTGLNRSTVGGLIADLVAVGLVRETEPVGKGVGRPSYGVEPVHERAYVLAIDLRVDRAIVALVGFGGAVLARREHKFRKGQQREERILAHLAAVCRDVLLEAPKRAVQVGVGIGVPGLVRQPDGLVRFAPNLGWVDVPLADHLRDELAVTTPVVVGNDSDLGAIAERLRGSAMGAANVVYLSGQVGVGGGIVIDGTLLKGAQGYGGEVGHMRVNPQGRECRCGATGCWETEIGEPAVRAAVGAADAESMASIAARAQDGDPAAVAGVADVGRWIAVGVANLVHIFNPDVVVFGGALRDLLPLVRAEVEETLTGSLPAPGEHVLLAAPALGDDSTLLGAAEAAFAPLLDDPLGVLTSGARGRPGRSAAVTA
ncbi:MAG TPA: ROK family transcriptional regulator [Candidatus Nanopelagicales bacterium]|nr:ROK family transcriptional regulator [Candidatus Nanopelagicales bacterium]